MARTLVLMLVAAVAVTACKTMPWDKKTTESEPVAELDPLDQEIVYTPPVVPEPGLQLAPEQRFKDIPLPMGLKEDIERTYVYESSSLQIGRMVYTSKDSAGELAQFFIRECPTSGWASKNVVEAETKTLLFTKPGKRLEIEIQQAGALRGRRVIIALTPETD